MGRKTAEQRVCHLLSQLADASEQNDAEHSAAPGSIRLQVPLTRAEMGDYLGLSLETVCRTMTCLQRKRLIEIGPRQRDITLLRQDRLRAMAG
jgi:CRP/FNR family transcriptional regulator